jgi:hypothetical protein
MTIKSSLIKTLLLGAVCAAGLAVASPSEARTYYSVSVGSGPGYYDSYYGPYDRGYRVAYTRPYYRHHHRRGYYVAYDSRPYYRGRYRCYTEWDGDRVCYRRY